MHEKIWILPRHNRKESETALVDLQKQGKENSGNSAKTLLLGNNWFHFTLLELELEVDFYTLTFSMV